jgi:hypothetical protein
VQDCGVNHIKEFTIFVFDLIELLKRYGFEKYKNTLFYFGVTGLFSALIFWIIKRGKLLELKEANVAISSGNDSWTDFINSMLHNFNDPLAILLAQIVMIILTARVLVGFQKSAYGDR